MKDFIRVDDWVPTKKDNIVQYDGKLIVIPFNKIFKRQNNEALNKFIIRKESYVKKLDHIAHYINYFIKYYDTDNEVLVAYLKLKYLVDNKSINLSISTYIKMIYNILLTPSIIEKINTLVEDNYYIDLSSGDDGKNYNETLEFTEEHAKVMMAMSMAMKLMVPVMFHYLNSYGLIKDRKLLYRFYSGLFEIFGTEIDIYNKLWISIYSKVNVNFVRNNLIWSQREITGTTALTHMNELFHDKIVSETFFKYVFNKNIISLNYVILDNQLRYFLADRYKTDRIELSVSRDTSGLSGLDKLEMNSAKIDESAVILSGINIKSTIKRMKKKLHVEISKEEIDYYIHNLNITKFQSQLVFYYYAKYFGGYRDLNLLNRKQYLKLLIMLKKKLQFEGYLYLPQLLSANIESKLNARTIRNDKFLTKIETSDIYQHIINDKYGALEDIDKKDLVINLLSTLLNTTFTFVDFDHKDQFGKAIEINQDVLSDEFLNYLNTF